MNETELAEAAITAERALLGAMLLDRDATPQVIGRVATEAFSLGRHRVVFDALTRLWERRIPADLVTVESAIRDMGIGTDKLPVTELTGLLDAVPTAVHAPFYADQVMAFAKRRAFVALGGQVAKAGYGPAEGLDAGEWIATFRDKIGQFDPVDAGRVMTAAEHGSALDDVSLQKWHGQYIDPVYPTGLRVIDKPLNGGLRPGQLIVVGARPGMCKTSLATTLAQRTRCHFVSLEMTADEIGKRMVAQLADVPYWVADADLCAVDLRNRWLEGSAAYQRLPVTISDRPQSTAQIEGDVVRLAAEHGTEVVCIDHLDWLSDKVWRDSQEQRTAELVRRCKAMAKGCGVAVVLFAQLNRNVEHRDGFVPQLSDFRNSGAIEQDADVCLLLRRRRYYSERGQIKEDESLDFYPNGPYQRVDVFVAKNRNGAVGGYQVGWKADSMRFAEVAA